MRGFFIALVVVLLAIQAKLWFGDGNVYQWLSLSQKINTQEIENDKLSKRNLALEADIAELKSGDQALEEQARYELGMVRDNEVYYQFVE